MTRIPVRSVIAETYRFVFSQLGRLIERIWLPATFICIGSFLFVRPYLYLMATDPDGTALQQQSHILLAVYVYYMVGLLFTGMMIAAIVLEYLKPQPGSSFFRLPPVGAALRIASGILGITLLLFLFILTASLVLAGLIRIAHLPEAVALAGTLLILALMLYPAVRLGLLMPAVATEESRVGLVRSWEMTKGNGWRLVLVLLATALPVVLLAMLLQFTVMGAEALNPHLELVGQAEAMLAKRSVQMTLMAERFPYITGITFFLTPLTYGLTVIPGAIIYRLLTKQHTEEVTATTSPWNNDKTADLPPPTDENKQ